MFSDAGQQSRNDCPMRGEGRGEGVADLAIYCLYGLLKKIVRGRYILVLGSAAFTTWMGSAYQHDQQIRRKSW
jgi:hypothetical protein